MIKKSDKMQAGNERLIRHEEADLWQKVTSNVKPLAQGNKVVQKPQSQSSIPVVKKPTPIVKIPTNVPADAVDCLVGKNPGAIDWRTARALKKGKKAIDARLDLHGMTQDEAYMALAGFIDQSQNKDNRSLLVITGKGHDGVRGVLRSMVPRWLNQPPNCHKVNSFSEAAAHDGGAGALYVLLKRKK